MTLKIIRKNCQNLIIKKSFSYFIFVFIKLLEVELGFEIADMRGVTLSL